MNIINLSINPKNFINPENEVCDNITQFLTSCPFDKRIIQTKADKVQCLDCGNWYNSKDNMVPTFEIFPTYLKDVKELKYQDTGIYLIKVKGVCYAYFVNLEKIYKLKVNGKKSYFKIN